MTAVAATTAKRGRLVGRCGSVLVDVVAVLDVAVTVMQMVDVVAVLDGHVSVALEVFAFVVRVGGLLGVGLAVVDVVDVAFVLDRLVAVAGDVLMVRSRVLTRAHGVLLDGWQ